MYNLCCFEHILHDNSNKKALSIFHVTTHCQYCVVYQRFESSLYTVCYLKKETTSKTTWISVGDARLFVQNLRKVSQGFCKHCFDCIDNMELDHHCTLHFQDQYRWCIVFHSYQCFYSHFHNDEILVTHFVWYKYTIVYTLHIAV